MFGPETHYKRELAFETMTVDPDSEKDTAVAHAEDPEYSVPTSTRASRRSCLQELRPFPAHRLSQENIFKSKVDCGYVLLNSLLLT